MFRQPQLPRWCTLAIVVLATVICLRYAVALRSGALQSGVGHVVAIRTYLFWALVCAPVAYLADILGRTALQYRLVRVAVARVKSRR